uniref:Uncharacterized protein n=1 Tax=Anguilla anguilla TaxID=7936 RepID=A0A0E9UH04_ANGAN
MKSKRNASLLWTVAAVYNLRFHLMVSKCFTPKGETHPRLCM